MNLQIIWYHKDNLAIQHRENVKGLLEDTDSCKTLDDMRDFRGKLRLKDDGW